jgi:energy-coupling factor transporter transmembrane protein EcfT
MFKINIITQLLSFFILAIVVNQLSLNLLVSVSIIFTGILFLTRTHQFLHFIKRFKWLFLILIAIFSFNTPGEHLPVWPFEFSPTYEGIAAGFTQILRIIIMLAAISLILAANTRQQLISGFYFVLFPLKILGLEVERFAARLWLTLQYVELQHEQKSADDFFNKIKSLTMLRSYQTNEDVSIVFKVPKFSWMDYGLIAFSILLLIKLVTKAFV